VWPAAVVWRDAGSWCGVLQAELLPCLLVVLLLLLRWPELLVEGGHGCSINKDLGVLLLVVPPLLLPPLLAGRGGEGRGCESRARSRWEGGREVIPAVLWRGAGGEVPSLCVEPPWKRKTRCVSVAGFHWNKRFRISCLALGDAAWFSLLSAGRGGEGEGGDLVVSSWARQVVDGVISLRFPASVISPARGPVLSALQGVMASSTPEATKKAMELGSNLLEHHLGGR